MRKVCILCAALLLSLFGCTVDVNELANSSAGQSSVVSGSDSDREPHSDVFYTIDTDSDTETETDSSTDTDTAVKAFDESKYLTMFVTGNSEIPLMPDAVPNSIPTDFLKCGDAVSIVQREIMEYSFVYSSSLEKFGYIPRIYLTDYKDESSIGEVMYVKPTQSDVYTDPQFVEIAYSVAKNDTLTVLAKRVDGKWRVMDKFDRVGYIDSNLLSSKRVKDKEEKKKNNSSVSESAPVDLNAPVVQSTVSSENSSSEAASSEEELVGGKYSGVGDAPDEYTVYVCDVDVGYLSLRAAPDKRGKSIGSVYYEDLIYVIDTDGDYWYVYVPKIGMYGYVTGDPNYLYPQ